MAGRKQAENVYKHTELIQDTDFDLNAAIPGFAVTCNLVFKNMPVFRDHLRSDFLGILLVTKGHLRISINMEEHLLGPNSLLLATPHALKQVIKTDETAELCGLSATIDFMGKMFGERMMDLMNYFSTQYCPHWQLDATDAANIAAIYAQLEQRSITYNTHPYGKDLFFHNFNILLLELGGMARKYARMNMADFSRKESLVMGFSTLVQTQFKQQRNVQAYAEQLHVTPKYLTETVKEITGKTAGELIDNFVILESKRLISETQLSILQIAEALHFSDQSFFGKYFKRHAGYSPKEYRALHGRL